MNLENLETGDILLFSDSSFWFSRLIEYMTNSPWSHVGIVLRDPIYLDPKLKGLYLWESGIEDIPDSEDGEYKFGIQIVDLQKKVEEYNGKVVLRKLGNIVNKNFKSRAFASKLKIKLEIIHNSLYNKGYDYSPWDLFCAWLYMDIWKTDYRRLDKLFCSAFVSYVYTELGYLNKNTNWSLIEPKHFSQDYTPLLSDKNKVKFENDEWILLDKPLKDFELPFINGYTLESEIVIKE